MTNEQLLYWIEGYLTDKHSTEAYTIKNKIAAQRSATTTMPASPRTTVPVAPSSVPVRPTSISEPDPF